MQQNRVEAEAGYHGRQRKASSAGWTMYGWCIAIRQVAAPFHRQSANIHRKEDGKEEEERGEVKTLGNPVPQLLAPTLKFVDTGY